jgi:hypothetical protein
MERKLKNGLPRYVLRKPLRTGKWAYYFNVPMWARKAGCPVKNESLGSDYAAARDRAETVLLPIFDSWRSEPPLTSALSGGIVASADTAQPLIGVYLLLLKGKISYVGSSLHMPRRVADHRSNGRPFDRVFYIATKANEREMLEATLIRAINPTQNRRGTIGPMERQPA